MGLGSAAIGRSQARHTIHRRGPAHSGPPPLSLNSYKGVYKTKYSQGSQQLITAETRKPLHPYCWGPNTCLVENRHQVTAWTRRTKKKQPVWSSDRDLVGRVDSGLREGRMVGSLPLKLRCPVPTTVMGHGDRKQRHCIPPDPGESMLRPLQTPAALGLKTRKGTATSAKL